jgi:acyl-CoA thioesterase FadM
MVRYICRTFFLLCRILLKPGNLNWYDTSIIKWIVLPGDLDLNLHLNNGAVMTILDFGRHDLSIRTGCLKYIIRDRWRPIVASSMIKFLKSLPPFAVFELHTSINCWDEKWIYYEQKLMYKGEFIGRAIVKGTFRNSKGLIPPLEIISSLGFQGQSPDLSEEIKLWEKMEF